MRTDVICNTESLAFPTLHYLNTNGMLGDVYTLERNAAVIVPQLVQIGIDRSRIALLKKKTWQEQLSARFAETPPEMVWVFSFPWKIPASLLSVPVKGFVNFHFGLLPVYKGADPVFWQIRNGERTGGLVIHRMTEEVDDGPVLHTEKVQMIPGETFGLYCQRMGGITAQLAGSFAERYMSGAIEEQQQPQSSEPMYWRKPSDEELTINWEQHSAEEIENLVNASNPRYGGASATIRGMEMRVLEVSPADVNDDGEQREPGLVVYADAVYGLIVACLNKQFLRISIVHTREGYMSGTKLFGLGIRAGERFTHMHQQQQQQATLSY
jgi:methionyl-tRNA formyltransferase